MFIKSYLIKNMDDESENFSEKKKSKNFKQIISVINYYYNQKKDHRNLKMKGMRINDPVTYQERI